MRLLMMIAKALAEENRVRMLMALRRGELCACQIVELFGLAPSTVSRHMWILRAAGLVEARKNGRWVHYRRAGGEASPEVRGALRWLDESLRSDSEVAADAKRLEEVRELDLEALCRAQQRRKSKPARPSARGASRAARKGR